MAYVLSLKSASHRAYQFTLPATGICASNCFIKPLLIFLRGNLACLPPHFVQGIFSSFRATAKPSMQPPRLGPMPPLAPSNPSQNTGKQVTDASAKLPPRHIHTASSNFDHVPTTGGPFAAISAQQQSQSPRSIQSTHAPLSQPREPVMVFPQKEPPQFEQTVRYVTIYMSLTLDVFHVPVLSAVQECGKRSGIVLLNSDIRSSPYSVNVMIKR